MANRLPTPERRLPTPELLLRRPEPGDRNFIVDAWLNSNVQLATRLHMPRSLYRRHQRRLIDRLWSDPECTWLVACLPKDPSFIFGWACGEASDAGPVLHFTYVKQSARRMGVATALLRAFFAGVEGTHLWCTHWTGDWWAFVKGGTPDGGRPTFLGYEVVTNPFLLWERWRHDSTMSQQG